MGSVGKAEVSVSAPSHPFSLNDPLHKLFSFIQIPPDPFTLENFVHGGDCSERQPTHSDQVFYFLSIDKMISPSAIDIAPKESVLDRFNLLGHMNRDGENRHVVDGKIREYTFNERQSAFL